MIELVVVVAIMLLLSAMALPRVVQSIRIYRLNIAASSLQNIMEIARFNAIRRNTSINLRRTTVAGQELLYVDLQGNGAYVNTDPAYFLPTDMQIGPAGAPAAASTALPNTQALGAGGCITFDSRGTVNYTNCGGGVPVVWFIAINQIASANIYRAVTITPMGQAKAWAAASGQNWKTM